MVGTRAARARRRRVARRRARARGPHREQSLVNFAGAGELIGQFADVRDHRRRAHSLRGELAGARRSPWPDSASSTREVALDAVDNQRLASLCGALDENLRQIESRARRRRSRGRGDELHASRGEQAGARRAARSSTSTSAPTRRRSIARATCSSALPSRRSDERPATHRGRGPQLLHAPRRPARPHAAPGRDTSRQILRARPHVRHRPGRHRQDLSRGRVRGRRAASATT